MKSKDYKVLGRAIEDGVAIGYRRAFKHDDNPSEEHVIETIRNEVMNEIAEWFTFDDELRD
jgi:predicted Zn-dependent protease with MMP-like domain